MQNVLGSKVFQEAKCSRDQNVLRSKMFFEAKYESAKCAKQKSVLGSKVCVSLWVLCNYQIEAVVVGKEQVWVIRTVSINRRHILYSKKNCLQS